MQVNQLKAGAAFSYFILGMGFLISIIYTPIMLRLLGQSEYGLYNLVSSVVSYLGLLSFGFGSAYMRYYSRYKVANDSNMMASLNGMFIFIYSMIGLIALVAGLGLTALSNRIFDKSLSVPELSKAKILMMIMVINLATSFPASVFNSFITVNEHFVFQKLLQMVKLVVNPLIMLPILLLGYSSIGMVITTTFLNIFIDVINLYYCIHYLKMRFIFDRFEFSLMREMAIFSSYIFLNMIIDQINWNVDKFIIGRFRGTVSVAIYGLAAQLNVYYLMLSATLSSVFIPRVNRLVAEGSNNHELTLLLIKVGRIQFVVLSLIGSGLVVFGRSFIHFWAGAEYTNSYSIALLLILPVTIPLIQNVGIEIQRAKNMHQFRSIVYFLIAIANVLISIPLTKSLGGVGAAIGTSLSLLIGNGLVMNLYYHFRIGLNMKCFWTEIMKIVPALAIPALFGFAIHRWVDLYQLSSFLLFGVIYVLIFLISVWFLALNTYEKDLFGKPILRLISKGGRVN